MFLVATTTTTAIAAASAAAAVGSFFSYLYFAHRSEAHAARDEAMALAATRQEVILDLRARIGVFEWQLRDTTRVLETRVLELEDALQQTQAEAHEQAYRMQRFYASSLFALLRGVQEDLEQHPPNIEKALARVRALLDDERPAA